MTELKEELKIGPDEGPEEYAERAEAVLERHREETGERLTLWGMLPGEGPGETLERIKALNEADKIEAAGRERRREPRIRLAWQANEKKEKHVLRDTWGAAEGTLENTRRFRIASQERDVEKAVSEFEAEKKRLYRGGVKLYSDEEHGRRLGKLTEDLRKKVEAVASEAAQDAEGYERETLALSYTDPVTQVPSSERGRLESARAFVKEDCEAMTVPALTERIGAVSAGSDKVGQVLHARYGRMRLQALEAESDRLAAAGRPIGVEAAREHGNLAEAVSGLEEDLKDPKMAERERALKEAATKSRNVSRGARSRLSEVDGTDERARQAQADRTRAML